MKIIIVLILTAAIFLSSGLALAADDIGQSLIHPASPWYFLKTIRETFELKLAGTPKVKMIRQLEFATRRLREVNSLTATSHPDLIAPALERYWFHLQALPDKDLENKQLASLIQDNLVIHLKVMEKVYQQISNTKAKMAIRTAVSRVLTRADLPDYAKVSSCNFLAKEASSSALNEVERAVYLQRSQKCFDSLKALQNSLL